MNIYTEKLDLIKNNGRHRKLTPIDSIQDRIIKINGKQYLNFSSNNYLGLANDVRIKNALIEGIDRWGAGSGASRFISGNMNSYTQLEQKMSALNQTQDSIVFGAGYTTNLGVISSLADKDDVVFIDRLSHASIIDGVKLSGAKMVVYKHLDFLDLEKKLQKYQGNQKIIITDAVFSMDGDIAPVCELYDIAQANKCLLIVDEAHSFGVFGETGLGIVQKEKLLGKPNMLLMGTFSKSVGLIGGYVSGEKNIIDYIRNKARSLIYSTAMMPGVVHAINEAVDIVTQDSAMRLKLWENIRFFQDKNLGLNVNSQIIPIMVPGNETVLKVAESLKEQGFYLPAIRFPTVKKGQERLRVSLSACHDKRDIDSFCLKNA